MRKQLIALADQLDSKGHYKVATLIDQLIKTAEACPECGDQNAYFSIDGIECPNKHCMNYNEQHAQELANLLGQELVLPTAQDILVD